MFRRDLEPTLRRLSRYFPIVAITGPRQSGKTTLARRMFADKPYVSLEDPAERAFAETDARGFLARFSDGAIFDEAQRWPDLFSHLQGIVDAVRTPGRFILTGSQQFDLLAGVTQSLSGRVAMAQLLPLSYGELPELSASPDQMIGAGGYPAIHAQGIPVADWFPNYVATYVERDVRQLLGVQDLSRFQRFLRLCAGRTGQLLNLSNLASETGITHSTARAWLSVLEASYIVFLLPPYHRNFGKRLVKTPKLYFVDTGLACWLLGIRSATQLATHPLRGALFETMIVGEFLKARAHAGQPADLYFWRDNGGNEADLLFEQADGLQTVEIKSGATVTPDYIQSGRKSGRFAGAEACLPWLIHGGTDADNYLRSGVDVISWTRVPARLRARGTP
ncbi:ATPase (AAA+ superfamily)-like protein [Burkholderiales bacterium GJ-E10]|nr:ATPase (AAA+ superfamily)-like protein [Burkholderiales bacterium GJ-E10]